MAEQSATTIAMVLEQAYMPLQAMRVPIPVPSGHQVLIKVLACGVCRTDLHILDGELPLHKLPLIPGHEVVGIVTQRGDLAQEFSLGARIGVP